MFRKVISCFLALAFLLACCGFSLADSGIEYDEDGGVWNFDTGVYTAPDGKTYAIENDDAASSSGSSSAGVTGAASAASGGMTVTDSSGVEIPRNADGSITVESGQIQIQDDQPQGSGGLTQDEWEARMRKAIERNGDYTETWYFGAEKEPIPVEVLYVGLGRSRIAYAGEQFMVNTCDLAWAMDVPAEQALAVVNANRAGYAALRANTSTKSFVMDHCITGSVVRVLSSGKNWTKVDYRGTRGYVLTSSLVFHSNSLRSYETGKICIDGRTTGRSTINIRANAKNNSRILGDYVLGTPLTIFTRNDKWCEVDVEGWHCYILTEYVSLEEPGTMLASVQ